MKQLIGALAAAVGLAGIEMTPKSAAAESVDPCPQVKVRTRLFRADEVPSVRQLEPFTWGITNGVLLRNGKPYFWLGNGTDLGAAQSTPLGLWLAKLQGVTMIAPVHDPGRIITCDRRSDGTVEVGSQMSGAFYPWVREAIRLGMLAELPVTSGNIQYGYYKPVIDACPTFAEVARFCGHFKALDTNYRVGRELIFAKRAQPWSFGAQTGFCIGELAREPGYDLSNRRGLEGFRAWARRKYGTIARANAVWRTTYTDFETLVPLHLIPEYYRKKTFYNGPGKNRMQKENLEMWLDFERFLGEDLLASFRGEVEDVRKNIPGFRIGIDFRSHMTPIDDYACYEPAAFSPYLDVSFIHDNGFEPFVYENEPWRRDVVCRETSYALMRMNFFRNNTATPLVDAESIVTGAPVVGSAGEAGGYVNDYIRYAKKLPFGERGYAAWVWSYFAGGVNGLMTWNWLDDFVRPYLPRVLGPLEAAAQATLPSVRHRRSDIAFLYPFAWARGLPSICDERGYRYVEWFDALAFIGREPETYGEIGLAAKLDVRRHKTLVAPHCEVTDRSTLELVKKYVTDGGRLIVTEDSFRRVFDDWGGTDFAAFAAAHPDRVTTLDGTLGFAALMPILRLQVGESELKVTFTSSTDELPIVHRVLAGDDRYALLYFANYGGRDQRLTATLPEKYRAWRLKPLKGTAERTGNDVRTLVPGSLGIFAAVLEAPGAEPIEVKVDVAAERELKRLAALYCEDPAETRPKVLFPKLPERASHDLLCVGKELFPNVVEACDRRGYATVSVSPDKWTDELLAQHPAVCLVEARNQDVFPTAFLKDGKFAAMLKAYVEKGGRLFLLSWTGRTTCAECDAFRKVAAAFDVWLSAPAPVQDPQHCAHGDPYQIVAKGAEGSPVTKGVGTVQLFALSPISGKCKAVPAVRLPDGHAAMATLEYGKGRVFFCADPMAFQPYRIEEADNRRLLENVFDWMLEPAGKPIALERTDDGVIYRGMVVHNVQDLVKAGDGRLLFRRAGAAVHEALGRQGKRMNEGSTGVELRFVLKGDSVKIRLGGDTDRSVSQIRIHYGDIEGDWPDNVRTVLGKDDEIVIPRKQAARRKGDRFDPSVVRLVLPYGSLGIRDVSGAVEPPSAALLPAKTYLAYGSSITHGSNAYVVQECYASLVGKTLGADVRNLGFSGSACMEREMADFLATLKFDFATLEMGVNVVASMPEAEYEKRVRYFVKRVAESHPTARILAIDIFGWTTGKPFDDKAKRYRAILKRVVAELACPNVTYVNGLDILPDDTEISLGQGVHPTPAGHRLMAEQIVARFREIMK